MTKCETVLTILAQYPEVLKYYQDEYDVDVSEFTEYSVDGDMSYITHLILNEPESEQFLLQNQKPQRKSNTAIQKLYF